MKTFFINKKLSVNHPSIHNKELFAGGYVCKELVKVMKDERRVLLPKAGVDLRNKVEVLRTEGSCDMVKLESGSNTEWVFGWLCVSCVGGT